MANQSDTAFHSLHQAQCTRIKHCCCITKVQNWVSAAEEELLSNCEVQNELKKHEGNGVVFSVICLGTFVKRQ